MSKLRVGIIGCGWVGVNRHLPAYRSHPAVGQVLLADRDRSKAAAVSRSGDVVCSDPLDLLDQEPDAVSICTSPWSHAELAIAALERGVHVLTEKPMALRSADAEAMVAAAASADRLLGVCHNFLYSRSVQQADRYLATLGTPTYACASQLSSFNRRLPTWYGDLPAGLLFDELPHMLYAMAHFLGPLELRDAKARWNDATGHLSSTEILVRGTSADGQVLAVFDSPVSEWHLTLLTERGVVDADLFREFASQLPPDGGHQARDILRTSRHALSGHLRGFAGAGARLVRRQLSWGHEPLVHGFVDAVLGHRDLPATGQEGATIVRLTDSIIEALGVTPP